METKNQETKVMPALQVSSVEHSKTMSEIYLCKHGFPYAMCTICQSIDEYYVRKWEQEFRKFDESNENAREEMKKNEED